MNEHGMRRDSDSDGEREAKAEREGFEAPATMNAAFSASL